jgi:hypothetical protein
MNNEVANFAFILIKQILTVHFNPKHDFDVCIL